MLNKLKIKKIKKIKNQIFFGKKFFLKKITYNNCNNIYLSWLNNKKINRYLESRFQKQNLKSIRSFVKDANKNNSIILFGIFCEDKHIGNIKIDINWNHKYATLGYLIGETKYHGRNITTEGINICTKICFNHLKLRFCFASAYKENVSSLKVLKKNKFKLVSKIKNVYKIKKNKYSDDMTYKLKNPKYKQ